MSDFWPFNTSLTEFDIVEEEEDNEKSLAGPISLQWKSLQSQPMAASCLIFASDEKANKILGQFFEHCPSAAIGIISNYSIKFNEGGVCIKDLSSSTLLMINEYTSLKAPEHLSYVADEIFSNFQVSKCIVVSMEDKAFISGLGASLATKFIKSRVPCQVELMSMDNFADWSRGNELLSMQHIPALDESLPFHC